MFFSTNLPLPPTHINTRKEHAETNTNTHIPTNTYTQAVQKRLKQQQQIKNTYAIKHNEETFQSKRAVGQLKDKHEDVQNFESNRKDGAKLPLLRISSGF